MRSAPAFQDVMMPWSVLLTIASSDEATIAASMACASARSEMSGRFSLILGRSGSPRVGGLILCNAANRGCGQNLPSASDPAKAANCEDGEAVSVDRRSDGLNLRERVTGPLDREHALQSHRRPLPRVGIDADLVHHVAFHQVLQHPAQVGQVDAEHRRAEALAV